MANPKYLPNIGIEELIRLTSFDASKYVIGIDEGARTIESMRLPTERLVSANVVVAKETPITPHMIKAKLMHELADYMYAKGNVDLEVIDNRSTHNTEHRMSAYVFTREQMLAFIRDVEDAVKEQLAQ